MTPKSSDDLIANDGHTGPLKGDSADEIPGGVIDSTNPVNRDGEPLDIGEGWQVHSVELVDGYIYHDVRREIPPPYPSRTIYLPLVVPPPEALFLYCFDQKYMMFVLVSMYGVPVMPTVPGMSPHRASVDRKGGARWRDRISLPSRASVRRSQFWFDAVMMPSSCHVGGV